MTVDHTYFYIVLQKLFPLPVDSASTATKNGTISKVQPWYRAASNKTPNCPGVRVKVASVELVRNLMAPAQRPHFVFRLNGRVHLKSTAGSRGVRISVSNAGYTTCWCGMRVLVTPSIRQFPLHTPLPCVTVCPHIPKAVYQRLCSAKMCSGLSELPAHLPTSHLTRSYKQGVSRLEDITAGGDFLGLCDQKSSYKHVSDFGRLRSYDRLKLGEGNDYWQ